MVQYAEECQESSIPYLYDPSQQIVRLSGDELRAGILGAHLLMVNEYEFEMSREKTAMSERDIIQYTEALIITKGENGATIYTRNDTIDIPVVPPTDIVDPTGVGDAYRAGLIKGLALGASWELAGQMGAVAAAFVLEEKGTQNHHYTRADFVARFREHFDDEGLLDRMLNA
jgi:adenosine kinase